MSQNLLSAAVVIFALRVNKTVLHILDTCCPNVLKQAELPIISQHLCNRPDHLSNQVTHNMFCAGFERGGVDACQVYILVNVRIWHLSHTWKKANKSPYSPIHRG